MNLIINNYVKQKIKLIYNSLKLFIYTKIFVIKTPIDVLQTRGDIKFKNVNLNVYSGLLWSNQRLVYYSIFSKRGKSLKILFNIPYKNITISSSTITSIHHGLWDNYYHWFIDSVPRIWFFWNKEIQRIGQIELYICRNLSDDEELLIQNLLPKNVIIKKINENQLIRSKQGIVPPFYSKDCNGDLPVPYLEFFLETAIKTFKLGHSHMNTTRKIFISRASARTRRFINQDDVESYFKSIGFNILKLEEYKIAEQAQFFYSADIIVGQHGAGLTNLLYARSNHCKVIEIFHSEDSHLNHYRGLCNAKNLPYTPIYLKGKAKNDDVLFDFWNYNSLFEL